MATSRLSQRVFDNPEQSIEEVRLQVLNKLYQRRAVVDDLIRSLEIYEQCQAVEPHRFSLSAATKCS